VTCEPQADPASRSATETLADNIRAIAELERRALHERTAADRLSDAITRSIGTARCAVGHGVFFVLWLAINTGLIPGVPPFDPFPFNFLTLVVSLEAIFLSVFVLMSQNRMTAQADKRGHLDLQVDLLAEQELTAILRLLQALCRQLEVEVAMRDDRIEELLQKTDIRHVASVLDQRLPKL